MFGEGELGAFQVEVSLDGPPRPRGLTGRDPSALAQAGPQGPGEWGAVVCLGKSIPCSTTGTIRVSQHCVVLMHVNLFYSLQCLLQSQSFGGEGNLAPSSLFSVLSPRRRVDVLLQDPWRTQSHKDQGESSEGVPLLGPSALTPAGQQGWAF